MAINGKTVLVTGGASGIGLECSKELLRNGVKSIAILDLPTSKGENIAAELEKEFGKGRVAFFACDVRNADQFEAATEKVVNIFNGLDIFVNNAGISNEKHLEPLVEINFTACVRGTMLALKMMGKNNGGKGGTVVNIASVAGILPVKYFPIYCGTKHAVVGYSRGISDWYKETGVRILVICPSYTFTPLFVSSKGKLLDLSNRNEAEDFASNIVSQPVEFVASSVIDILKSGKNGSTWVVENSQPPYTIEFPYYQTLKSSDK